MAVHWSAYGIVWGDAQVGHLELCPSTCCVHCFCTNDFRNSIGLTFYRFRKEESTRREYMSLLRSVADSTVTRLFCALDWTEYKAQQKSPSIDISWKMFRLSFNYILSYKQKYPTILKSLRVTYPTASESAATWLRELTRVRSLRGSLRECLNRSDQLNFTPSQ